MSPQKREETRYRTLKLPETLMSLVDTLVTARTLGYRSAAEFVAEAVRRRLEELGVRPREK